VSNNIGPPTQSRKDASGLRVDVSRQQEPEVNGVVHAQGFPVCRLNTPLSSIHPGWRQNPKALI